MNKPEIIEADFRDWQQTNWVEYASWTNRDGERLRFQANMLINYLVTLGNGNLYKNLYYGIDFNEAKKAFDTERRG